MSRDTCSNYAPFRLSGLCVAVLCACARTAGPGAVNQQPVAPTVDSATQGGTAAPGEQAGASQVTRSQQPPMPCWQSSVIAGFNVHGLWGRDGHEIWAVGERLAGSNEGRIYSWNGRDWNLTYSTPNGRLFSIWGSGSDDIWIGGDWGTLVHWDGTRFIEFKSGQSSPISSIWGSSGRDIWANGPPHTLLRYHGKAWELVPFSQPIPENPQAQIQISALFGFGSNDVWAAGYFGHVLHFDGTKWQAEDAGTREHLRTLWGTGPQDLWVGGAFGTVLHRDSSGWTPTPFPAAYFVERLWGKSEHEIWATTDRDLFRWDGRSWSSVAKLGAATMWEMGGSQRWAARRDRFWQLLRDCSQTSGAASKTQPLETAPAENEDRQPDTIGEFPPSESEARALVAELIAIAKARDPARFRAMQSWKQRARTSLEIQVESAFNNLPNIESQLRQTQFATTRYGGQTNIRFDVRGKPVLIWQVTREGGRLRLNEN
jgi:hypothetical protein